MASANASYASTAAPVSLILTGAAAADNVVEVGVSGTYGTAVLAFSSSNDGGVTWFPVSALRADDFLTVDATTQSGGVLTGFNPGDNNIRRWFVPGMCDTGTFRVTLQSMSTGTINIRITSSIYPNAMPSAFPGSGATTPQSIVTSSATAFVVGQTSTNPALKVSTNAATSATGFQITSAAAASGAALAVISSGTNENGTIDAKGSGTLTLNSIATGNIVLGAAATGVSLTTTGLIKSSGTAGIGYATGAGGTVAQITSRTTGVTLSKTSGQITLVSAAGSATPFTMTVTNTLVAATDTVIVNQVSGTDKYSAVVSAVAGGSYALTITDLTGTTTETPVFNVVVIKGVSS
jgi:hypothetical protein